MDAYTYWSEMGTEAAKHVAESAGTSWAYFVHIAHKRKRPSVDLARKLVKHSGGALELEKLLFSKEEKNLPKPKNL
jgi:phosphoribosyl 1,2-cyclic phosphodiesterase